MLTAPRAFALHSTLATRESFTATGFNTDHSPFCVAFGCSLGATAAGKDNLIVGLGGTAQVDGKSNVNAHTTSSQ